MYRSTSSGFAKKLRPARKAWKSFTATLQSKVQKVNLPRAINTIKNATTRGLEAALRSLRRLVPVTRRLLNRQQRRPYSSTFSRSVRHHLTNYGPIYIDELYEDKVVVHAAKAETSCNKERAIDHHHHHQVGCSSSSSRNNMMVRREKSPYDVEDAWRAVVAMSPQLRPVDERAHDFISKVRQDMHIESQRSNLEFQEMLKRSV